MIQLNGKVALVVGGTSGIGLAAAHALAQAGAAVVATSRSQPQTQAVAQALRAKGTQTLEITTDAASTPSVQATLGAVMDAFGCLDIVVAAQGIHQKRASEDVADDAFAQILNVNLHSVFTLCREAHPLLKAAHGCIVTIASMGSFIGLKDAAAYTASKGAVAQLTKALAIDWAKDGIRVNAVAPGWIETPLSAATLAQEKYRVPIERRIPMGRIGQPEDVAGAIVFLASDLAAYITGSVLVVDGGALASV
jgi:NAD(P)-dependent dehydrogenase (short-subunit alcohol dehydrogenase family)